VHALLGSARTAEHLALVRALLDGTQQLDGLVVDTDLRWAMVQTLAAHGRFGDDEIAAEVDRDPSAAGQRHAATARALRPSAEAKAEAWNLAVHDDSLPNAMVRAVVAGFAHPIQGQLVAPYVQRYFDEVSGVWERRTNEVAQSVVVGMFPVWGATIGPETVGAADALLADDSLPTALRRLVAEGRADVQRALRAREVDAAAR
jgi:aminopeptidase N